jgi:hypothetical protein
MTYKLIDLYTEKVLGEFATQEQAVRAESHLVHEPNETRYEIKAPVKAKKTKAKKANAEQESN